MAKTIVVILVNPAKRTVARLAIKPSLRAVRLLLGAAGEINARRLVADVNGEDLFVGSRTNVARDHQFKEWRIRGGENTVGEGVLFGAFTVRTAQHARETGKPVGTKVYDGMWNCPVDVAWVESRIVWCEPGEDAPAAEVEEAMADPDADQA